MRLEAPPITNENSTPMKKMEVRRRQIVPSRPKNTPLHRLINDYDRPIEISPVHVLIISLLFIANVFLLHLYARFGSGSSLYQVVFAAVIVLASILLGMSMNKR